jgi:TRAP transporter 4TM/12TM fusion protein
MNEEEGSSELNIDTDTLFDLFLKERKIILLLGSAIPIALGIFHLYTSFVGILNPWTHRIIHLIGMFLIIFFSENVIKMHNERLKFPRVDYFFIFCVIFVSIYAIIEHKDIVIRYMGPTSGDIFIGTILIILVLEATRRKVGYPLVILSLLLIVYSFVGKYVPGKFGHPGFSYSRLIEEMFVQTNGILGIPMGAASVFIIIFIMFGAFLIKSGAGKFFIDLSLALAGRSLGGPAKTAVVASAIMGTISGSAVANTVTTGTFTIPLMKKTGLKGHFAAAVEATASLGGSIMPPVMSAAAFIIAEFTGTPYRIVMLRALVPAILFFSSIYFMIHLEALKTGMKVLDKSEIPQLKKVLKTGGHNILVIFLLLFLLAQGMSPMRAGLFAIFLTIVLAALNSKNRMSISKIISAIELGVRNTSMISITCAAAGIIVGAISLSGLGVKFSSMLYSIAGENLFLLLFLTMISAIIMGMGMPIVPAYIIVAALGVPALTKAGLPIIVSHMFVFYFAVISGITPPVALCAYAAAGIAGEKPFKVAITSLRIGLIAFIIPFMFAYDPRLMLIGGTIIGLIRILITAFIGIYILACGLQNWMFIKLNFPERILSIVSSLFLIYPTLASDGIGFLLFLLVFISQLTKSKKEFKEIISWKKRL